MIRLLAVAAALAPLAGPAAAQDVGSTMTEAVELEDFTNIEAESYDELLGRTVLLEFFAYW